MSTEPLHETLEKTFGGIDEALNAFVPQLQAARESFPKSAAEQLHKEFADMRNEWDGRGWEAPR